MCTSICSNNIYSKDHSLFNCFCSVLFFLVKVGVILPSPLHVRAETRSPWIAPVSFSLVSTFRFWMIHLFWEFQTRLIYFPVLFGASGCQLCHFSSRWPNLVLGRPLGSPLGPSLPQNTQSQQCMTWVCAFLKFVVLGGLTALPKSHHW